MVCLDFLHRTLDLADVVGDVFREIVTHVVRQLQAVRKRFILNNRVARLIIGRLNIDDQTPFKARAQTLLQAEHIARHAVGGQDDLTLVFVEGVEGVEKFLLRRVLAGDKLNVVDQKQVGVAVFVAELEVFAGTHRFNKFVGELVALDVNDVVFGVLLLDAVGDGIEQVGLAEAGLAVEKQGVIDRGALLRDGLRGGKRVLVGRADDEGVEGELRVKFREIAARAVARILREFVLVQHDKLDLRLKLLAHGLLDQLGIAI